MPLKKPSEFYNLKPNTSMDEVKDELSSATPAKVETLSEAFNVFKTNLNHIQTISDFTNKFDTFEANVEKVETLSNSVEEIRENLEDLIKREDLDEAMTAHLFFVEESIKNVQDKVKTLNSKSILDIKEEFASLSDTVADFIGEEVPSYKKLIVDSETRVDSRFIDFKEDLVHKVQDVHEDIYENLSKITKNIESINKENLSSVEEEVQGIRGKVESLLEKVLPKYKKFFAETEIKVDERISAVKETADEIEEKYEIKIKDIKDRFEEFANTEIPKYKNLLVESKIKTEEEVRTITRVLDKRVLSIGKSVDQLQENVNKKGVELDENLLEKTQEIERLIEDSKKLSKTHENLYKDFKNREIAENKKLEGYEETLTGFSNRMNEMETTLSDNICELQENLDTSTSKYYDEMKNAVVPAVVNFERNLSEKLKDLQINFTVNEKHVDSLKKEFKDLIEKLRVDELEERSNNLTNKVNKLEEVLDKFDEKTLTEGLLNIPPNVDNSDPLTPLDQKYATLEDLQSHYRLFINRIQQQLSTLGGGGAVRLDQLDDVALGNSGIQTNGWTISWDSSLKLFTPSAGGSAGAAGTWASSSVGVSTTKNVGIATTARSEYSLYVGKGPTAGSATTTVVAYFDGDISVGGTIFKENVKNVDSIGLVTARSGVDVGYDYDGGTGIGATLTSGGDAVFAGIVTASYMFYPPVITTTKRDSLTVSAGALIFNTTSAQLEIYNGTSWVGVGAVNNLTISNL